MRKLKTVASLLLAVVITGLSAITPAFADYDPGFDVDAEAVYFINLDTGKVFKRGAGTIWICLNCGHLYTGETPPSLCPVCKHPQSYFQLHVEDY